MPATLLPSFGTVLEGASTRGPRWMQPRTAPGCSSPEARQTEGVIDRLDPWCKCSRATSCTEVRHIERRSACATPCSSRGTGGAGGGVQSSAASGEDSEPPLNGREHHRRDSWGDPDVVVRRLDLLQRQRRARQVRNVRRSDWERTARPDSGNSVLCKPNQPCAGSSPMSAVRAPTALPAVRSMASM